METEQSTLIGISHGDPTKAVWVRSSLSEEEIEEIADHGVHEVRDAVLLDENDPASLLLIHSEGTSAGNLNRAADVAVTIMSLLAHLRNHEVKLDETAQSIVSARET